MRIDDSRRLRGATRIKASKRNLSAEALTQ